MSGACPGMQGAGTVCVRWALGIAGNRCINGGRPALTTRQLAEPVGIAWQACNPPYASRCADTVCRPNWGLRQASSTMSVDLYNTAYHITHYSNLASIARNGLLACNNLQAMGLKVHDISDAQVQERRAARVEPVHGRSIHDYVPLYLNPRNPMMYRLQASSATFVILAVNIERARPLRPLFTDGNAACSKTVFDSDPAISRRADTALRARYWCNHPGGKRQRCAEMLLHWQVPCSMITSVHCPTPQMLSIAEQALGRHAILDKGLFF